ncbi:MAG TPA: response regulator [Humisphaera sp.]
MPYPSDRPAAETRPTPTPRVLLVEDDRFAGPALARLLWAAGYRVAWVESVAAAVAAVAVARDADPFAAVVSDLLLPDGLGWEAFPTSRAVGVTVVLAMTAGDPALLAEARRRGASAVIRKPFDFADLAALLPPP